MDVLQFTHSRQLASVHLSLTDSYELLACSRPSDVFLIEDLSGARPCPRSVSDALSPRFVNEFGPAMDRENAGFLKHECFQPVSLPAGARLLPCHWLFSYKRDGTPKARFVLGGHRQRLGMDYFEHKNYCAVLSSRDNRILLALAAAEQWSVYQTDVVQAFLHGVLDDVDIFINPPERYPCPPGTVLKLRKAVYGLHQAPVKFKQEVVEWFRSHGYQAANQSETIWFLRVKDAILIHALYADDFLHFTSDPKLYQSFQQEFKRRFEVKSDRVEVYLGNRIVTDTQRLRVHLDQSQYSKDLLERFGMASSTPVATPMVDRLSAQSGGTPLGKEDQEKFRGIVGSLLYLSCWSRPDIAFAVSELSRFVSSASDVHMKAAKHLLRYLKGTVDIGLNYSRPTHVGALGTVNQLWGYVDSDWAGCADTRKSTSGYVLMLNRSAIAWKSKRQSVVALSTAEAEFIAASAMVQEVIYTRRLLEILGFPQVQPTPICEDNRTCIAWSEGSVGGSERAKHIDLRAHFVHEAVKDKHLVLQQVSSWDNVADLMTKPLPAAPFQLLRKRLLGL
jgi:hypothetical protein